MKSWQLVLLGTLFGLLAAGLVLLVATRPVKSVVTILHPSQTSSITVDVSGAVMHPGVYNLSVGSRINDAVQIAGGFSPTADSSAVNLAAVIRDGEKILIPEIAATIEKLVDSTNANTILVNLNTATEDELELLPGIGPQKASAIVTYRESYGNFQTISDLLYVPGIGQSIIDTFSNYVTVNP